MPHELQCCAGVMSCWVRWPMLRLVCFFFWGCADNIPNALAPVDRECLEKQRPEHLVETVPGTHNLQLWHLQPNSPHVCSRLCRSVSLSPSLYREHQLPAEPGHASDRQVLASTDAVLRKPAESMRQ